MTDVTGSTAFADALRDRYTIERELGRGGMATVYLGRDLKHGRRVAIKVLRPELAAALGPERFLQEITTTSQLQHPHILPLYDSGEAAGLVYYVMPFVEGESLRGKLDREKQLGLEETVAIATTVARALQYAHEHGVVHRDIKPENILLTGGQPMVADFGIALAISNAGGTRLTETGLSLGTPHYMSPEQATGDRQLDARTDVYSLAATVYEMLVGEPPHVGQSAQAVITKILSDSPPSIARFRALVSPNVDAAVQRALAKSPADRFPSAGKFAEALTDPAFRLPNSNTHGQGLTSDRTMRALQTALVLSVALTISMAWVLFQRRATAEPTPIHLAVLLPPGISLPMETGHPVLVLSPDGGQLVFVGEERGVRRLYRRALGDREVRAIPGTEGAAAPFFAPDGNWVAFFDGSLLKKVALSGGLPVLVSATTPAAVSQGASWITADSVVIALSFNSGLSATSVSGSHVAGLADWKTITTDSTAPYAFPTAVYGTPYVIFTDYTSGSPDKASIGILDRRSQSTRTIVVGGTSPLYSPPNRLLFVRGGALYANEVDLRHARSGAERRVLDSVVTEPTGAGHVAVSGNGTMAYVTGPVVTNDPELVWVQRDGTVSSLFANGRTFSFPHLSPDGTRLAVTSPTGANYDVHVLAISRLALDRVTTHPGEDFGAVWSPDGTRLAFSGEEFHANEGPHAVWQIGREGRIEQLMRTPGEGRRSNWDFPTSWSPDGKWIAYTRTRENNPDVEVIPTSAPGTSRPVASDSNANEYGAVFSPDSRFLAYVSDESGTEEIYVQAFPEPGRRIRISNNGATEPLWNRNGRELFYRHGDELMSVRFDNDSPLEPLKPTVLFTGHLDTVPYGGRQANYDVSPDGSRFVFVRRKNLPHPTVIHVVVNWPIALGRSTAEP